MMISIETIIVHICIILLEAMIFGLPAYIPYIKHKALIDNRWRWQLILLLGCLCLLFNLSFRLWIVPIDEVAIPCSFRDTSYYLCEERFDIQWIIIDLNEGIPFRSEIAREIRWRYIIFWDNQQCFTDDEMICDAVNHWLNKSQTKTPLFLPDVIIFMICSSCLTGFMTYHITRDKLRKEKQKHNLV